MARLPAGWQPAVDTLADRVILVTGAYGGLGGAVARAAMRSGATVVITGKRKRQLEKMFDVLREEGLGEAVIHPLDMEAATPKDYSALADGLERDFGRLDGIVHCAASFAGLTPIAMHRPDDWLRAMHVNVNAPFALTQACMPLLHPGKRQRRGVRAGRPRAAAARALGWLWRIEGGAGAFRGHPARGNRRRRAARACIVARAHAYRACAGWRILARTSCSSRHRMPRRRRPSICSARRH